MRIARATLRPLRLPLRRALATAHGPVGTRRGALFELEAATGQRGFGEALPLPGFGLETAESAQAALVRIGAALVGAELCDTARLEAELVRVAPAEPAARAAAEIAWLDLASRAQAEPLAAWLAKREGRLARERVPVCRLLLASEPEAAAQAARRAAEAGFAALKLKIGAGDPGRDLARVAAVREAAGAAVALRLDANGAWDERAAHSRLRALAPFAIEWLEQPVAASDVEALARLRREASFPLAADEAVRGEREAAELLARGAADLLVLKPAALGGLLPARRIAQRAEAQGVRVVASSFLDSALGRAAALALAATLPGDAPAAGLGAPDLLAEDLADDAWGEAPVAGPLLAPGLGVAPEPARLSRCAGAPIWEKREARR